VQCAENLCGKKKTTAWKMKNEKPKRQAHNVFFFFEAAKSKNVSATRAFPPSPSRLSLVPQAKKRKAGKWEIGAGCGQKQNKN